MPDSTSDSFVNTFANLSSGEKERLFPELKKKTTISANINADLMKFMKTMVIQMANEKRRPLQMQPIVDVWALFFMDLMQEFQAKHNTTNFDEAVKKKKWTPGEKCMKVKGNLSNFWSQSYLELSCSSSLQLHSVSRITMLTF